MKNARLGLLLVLICIGAMISTGLAGDTMLLSSSLDGVDDPVTSEGLLIYFPPPDLTICFCGSYYLENTDREQKSYYLLAPGLDLTQYIGKEIVVTGKPAVIPCTGTLLQICDFLVLHEVQENAPAPDEDTTWGKIKALYK